MSLTRRSFLHRTTVAALGAGVVAAVPMELLAALRKKVAPSDTLNVALIGCRGMGWSNLTSMLKNSGVNVTALCDVDQNVLAQRKEELQKIGARPTLYTDYRQLLQQKDVDAVIIATPDHWHCLQMMDACAAGKDVYVEKPVSNSIREAELMVAAAKKWNRVVQVNQWQRSQQHFKDAVAMVQSGKMGNIWSTKTWMYRSGTTPLPVLPDSPVPPGVDYGMWLGPAPKQPFNKNRFHYEFRWFWNYAGGLMTDWGVHLIDMVLLGMNAPMPKSVVATGGKLVFPDDARQTPDLQSVLYDYGNFQMTWEHHMGMGTGLYGLQHGIAFLGENGTLLLNRSGWELRPEKVKDAPKMEAISWQKSVDRGLDNHTVNFVDVVKSRQLQNLACPIEAGARVAIHCHMGNIAQRTGEKITWNSTKNSFNEKEANKLIAPVYQNGWKLPQV